MFNIYYFILTTYKYTSRWNRTDNFQYIIYIIQHYKILTLNTISGCSRSQYDGLSVLQIVLKKKK